MNNSQGFDLSHWQGVYGKVVLALSKVKLQGWILPDFKKAKAAGMDFGFAKASQGISYHDPLFPLVWQPMKDAGLLRGPYHYVEAAVSAKDQLANFLGVIPKSDSGEMFPMLDAENWGPKGEDCISEALEIAEGLLKYYSNVVLYTSPGYWTYGRAVDSRIKLYDANWNVANPLLPIGFTDYSFWQKFVAKKGTVPGFPLVGVDRAEFNGDYDALQDFCKGITPTPVPVGTIRNAITLYGMSVRNYPSVAGNIVGSFPAKHEFQSNEEIVHSGLEVWLKIAGENKYVAKVYGGTIMCKYV